MRKIALLTVLLGTVLAAAVLATPGQAQETKPAYTVEVDGLACPFCAYGIEKQILALEGVQTVETDIKSGTVTVTMAPGLTLDEDAARKAVEAAGFTMRGFKRHGAGE